MLFTKTTRLSPGSRALGRGSTGRHGYSRGGHRFPRTPVCRPSHAIQRHSPQWRQEARIKRPMRCHVPFVNQVYAADCRRSMIARTSSILSSVMRSTGRSPPRSRCGLNSQTRASPGGYTWPSWPANHSSRRSRVRLFGRGVDRPVCQRETVCGVVSKSCAISRPLMPPDSLMLSSFRATAVPMDPPLGQQAMNIDIYIVTNISVNVKPASRYHGPTSNISRHRDPRLDGLYQTRYTWPNDVRLPKPKKLPAAFYQTPAGNEPARDWLLGLDEGSRRIDGDHIITNRKGRIGSSFEDHLAAQGTSLRQRERWVSI